MSAGVLGSESALFASVELLDQSTSYPVPVRLLPEHNFLIQCCCLLIELSLQVGGTWIVGSTGIKVPNVTQPTSESTAVTAEMQRDALGLPGVS